MRKKEGRSSAAKPKETSTIVAGEEEPVIRRPLSESLFRREKRRKRPLPEIDLWRETEKTEEAARDRRREEKQTEGGNRDQRFA
ncbi:hypothetical protein HanRHA438_Chr06g0279981 [Helianthus annuus]|nr:hypothetical protein HanIR_Chr06g0290951 [Helianthus annuus]KAJ0912943.1 hypothetical protein HanRHA438_Chr06g0279981 [Helianthus annuus]